MATYAFKAIDGHGAPAQGEVEALDEAIVLSQLRARGLIVLRLSELKPADVGDMLARFKRASPRDITVMTRQLATMINAGMPMLRALYALEDQTPNEPLRIALVDIRKRVEAGGSLSESFSFHPSVFNELYVAMVRSGETGGILDQTLLRVADQLEKSDSLRRQIRSAMVYPIMIATFAAAVLIALVAFLIPVFAKVLEDVDPGGDLPAITQVSIGMSDFLTQRWYLVIGIVVAVVVCFRQWKRSKGGKSQWDRLKLRIPFRIGTLVHKIALARFTRTFAGLISGGVPVLETLEIAGRTSGNAVVEEAMERVREAVKKGTTIADPMRAIPKAFPPMVPNMIEIGEESGALEQMLDKIADFYEDEVAAAIKGLASMLEPLMIIIIGGVVGFIVISMYLPMFQLYDKIR